MLCHTRLPGPVQRVSEVASDRHALDRCVEHLRDVRDRHRLAHARQRRGDLRAVQFDDQDRDGGSTARRATASTISTAAGSDTGGDGVAGCSPGILDAAESGEHRLYRLRDASRTLKLPGDQVERRRVAVAEVGHEDLRATVQCVDDHLAISWGR
jgi:hypothetical protein